MLCKSIEPGIKKKDLFEKLRISGFRTYAKGVLVPLVMW